MGQKIMYRTERFDETACIKNKTGGKSMKINQNQKESSRRFVGIEIRK